MKLLIVDGTTEGQSVLAARVHRLDPGDIETLDIKMNLASPDRFIQCLDDVDILLLGPRLGEQASALARSAKAQFPTIEILMFVSDDSYRSGAFRFARSARVRKVLPENCDQLDFLQELVNIHADLCEGGKVSSGKVIVVAQAKGGVGATTVTAALGELCNEQRKRTLLWDSDIESRDLTRALMSDGLPATVVNDFIEGRRELTRENFIEALSLVGDDIRLLPPPKSTAAAFDFVGHPDCIHLSQRVLDLAKITFENIIFDTAGRLGPTTGALMRAADGILIVADDSMLGMMALDSYLNAVLSLLSHRDNVWILCSGSRLSIDEIRSTVDEHGRLPDSAWTLPPLPFDAGAEKWPGSGKSLYGHGTSQTKEVLTQTAQVLELVNIEKTSRLKFRVARSAKVAPKDSHQSQGLMKRVMNFSFSS